MRAYTQAQVMHACASTHTACVCMQVHTQAHTHKPTRHCTLLVSVFTERPEEKKERESETNMTAGILKQDQTTETVKKECQF